MDLLYLYPTLRHFPRKVLWSTGITGCPKVVLGVGIRRWLRKQGESKGSGGGLDRENRTLVGGGQRGPCALAGWGSGAKVVWKEAANKCPTLLPYISMIATETGLVVRSGNFNSQAVPPICPYQLQQIMGGGG